MASTETTQAISSPLLRWDTVTGRPIGSGMAVTGIAADDLIIFAYTRNTTTSVPTDRLATITLGAGSFTSSADLTGLPVEILWHDVNA